jgi:8-oxo-dGTP pyrophosphatase MutT (NUDIX family)
MRPADEIVVIVDRNNRVVGEAPRREMRARRLPHRCTYIVVSNTRGELYIQKRARTKDVLPGYHEVAGGVVLAGESYEAGAARELAEELGIRGVPLVPLFDFYFADADGRIWGRAFSCVHDGAIVLQEEEVESGAFMSRDEVRRLTATDRLTPDTRLVLRRYLGPA